jgi:hypothetical protein
MLLNLKPAFSPFSDQWVTEFMVSARGMQLHLTPARSKLVHTFWIQYHATRKPTILPIDPANIFHCNTVQAARSNGSPPGLTESYTKGGLVRVFGQKIALEDAIGSHACSLEALTCV